MKRIKKSDIKSGIDYPLTMFNKNYLQKNGYYSAKITLLSWC